MAKRCVLSLSMKKCVQNASRRLFCVTCFFFNSFDHGLEPPQPQRRHGGRYSLSSRRRHQKVAAESLEKALRLEVNVTRATVRVGSDAFQLVQIIEFKSAQRVAEDAAAAAAREAALANGDRGNEVTQDESEEEEADAEEEEAEESASESDDDDADAKENGGGADSVKIEMSALPQLPSLQPLPGLPSLPPPSNGAPAFGKSSAPSSSSSSSAAAASRRSSAGASSRRRSDMGLHDSLAAMATAAADADGTAAASASLHEKLMRMTLASQEAGMSDRVKGVRVALLLTLLCVACLALARFLTISRLASGMLVGWQAI